MGSRYILDINSNDELHSVIKKCNSNFKAIVGQLELQTKNDKRTRDQDKQDTESAIEDAVDDATEEWNQELGDAVDDLVDAIEAVDDKFDNYTKTEDLAAVALSGDYNDLINTPAAQSTQVDTDILKFNTNGNFTATGYRAHRYGNVVTISLKFNTLNQIDPTNYYPVGSVSTTWLPSDYVSGTGLAPAPIIADLSSTGSVRIKPTETIPANNQLHAHFSFIVQ